MYEVDWSGTVTFWDEYYNTSQSLFSFGDTVYARIQIDDDTANYQLFTFTIQQCYVCTANISDNGNLNDISDYGCLDGNVIDSPLFYIMPFDTDLDFTTTDDNDANPNIQDFTFTLPVLADDVFFVDCTIELELIDNNNTSGGNNQTTTNTNPEGRRRIRRLLQNNADNGNNKNMNTYDSAIGYAFIQNPSPTTTDQNPNNNGNNNNNANTSVSTMIQTTPNANNDIGNDLIGGNNSNNSNNSDDGSLSTFEILILIGVLIFIILFGVFLYNYQKKKAISVKNIQTSVDIIAAGMENDDNL